VVQPLLDQVADRGDERRVRTHGPGANDVEADLPGDLPGLDIEVVQHLHVVGDEAERGDDDVLDPRGA
jgi:hypothetical protein